MANLIEGLSQSQVAERSAKAGPNELVGKPLKSDWYFLWAQFKNPLVLVLVTAGLVTLGLGDTSDAGVIGVAVLVNTVLGFVQERRAYHALEALKRVLAPEAWVMRDGQRQKIDARGLVPGDVVLLYEGDRMPADGLIVESNDLLVNEAFLTGESVSVEKVKTDMVEDAWTPETQAVLAKGDKAYNSENLAYMGTTVAGGSGKMVVTAIGMQTEMGKIAQEVGEGEEEKTPLEKRLRQLAGWLTWVVIVTAGFVFAFGLWQGRELAEMFEVSVALAVAAIPEGLVVALTAILAIGMQRILKRKAVVRKLVAAETLGSVTTVCMDKTGTLTEGKMRVVETKFVDEKLGFLAAMVANEHRDATEIARVEWGREKFKDQNEDKGDVPSSDQHTPSPSQEGNQYHSVEDILERYPQEEILPFSSETRFLAVRSGEELFMAGAPEELLRFGIHGTTFKKQDFEEAIDTWASQGRRLIGFAYGKFENAKAAEEQMLRLKRGDGDKHTIGFVGMMAFEDPVRESVRGALVQAANAGIKLKVITGDYKQTALSVLRQLGIEVTDDDVLEGVDLEKMSDEELQKRVEKIVLFARTRPVQKLQIVRALKANGEVIGMMGDGVNDAPALAASDIGMVVGDASEVAKEASDLVLLDSNFKTILAAVEEGRGIFDNLRKVILYLMSGIFSEMIIVIGSLIFHWPLGIGAAQILWINMVGDGLPSLALTIDPKDKDLLTRKPIRTDAKLINSQMRILISLISVLTGVSCLVIFRWLWPIYGDVTAQSVVYATLGLSTLVYVFSCQSLRSSIWGRQVEVNWWLIWSVLGGVVLLVMGMYVPWLQQMLELRPLDGWMWGVAVGVSLLVLVIIEVVKWMWRLFSAKR